MFGLNKKPVKNETLSETVQKMNLKKLKDEVTDLKEAAAVSNREHNRTITKKNEAINELNDRLSVFQELENNRVEQQVTAIELSAREELLDAQEAQFSDFKKELKANKEEANELAEAKYKTGYSDGLADGLRKIYEITADDRKQAMQVAALAASSHTPKAAEKLADGIRTNLLAESNKRDDDEEEEADG